MGEIELEFAPGMAKVPRAEWDLLAARYGSPLLSWGYLSLLEASGSMTPETGWQPAHALARRGGELVAAAPFYVKSHSWGEFVFDFEFDDIARRLGSAWYPKLVGMVPATPAPAWRVLARPGEEALAPLVVEAAAEAARGAGLCGLHVLWPEPGTAASLRADRAFVEWKHQAFLWTDSGYGGFEGYLESFSKNMRRNVRREREAVRAAGITTRMLGPREAAAAPGLLELMADLYESHNAKFGPWAARFLERDFFLRLPEFMPDGGWAIAAAYDGEQPGAGRAAGRRGSAGPIALAFFLEGGDRLYGRFWGVLPDYERGGPREASGLHFELCYYLPIEYALAKGISSFDPGMGSPHKARRGFRSVMAPSFHMPFDPRMAYLMEEALREANELEEAEAAALDEELPFKRPRPG
jgi:predicted N-acyltransferase